MKKKSARYFGMTVSQVSILAGTTAVALLAVCGLSWFIFMTPPSAPPAPSAPTPVTTEVLLTPSPTVIVVDVTSTPTGTPPPAIATSAPPAGWVEFQTQGATIWLPNNFVGGDTTDNEGETIQKIDQLGTYFRNVIVAIKNAPPQVSMWMVDKTTDKSSLSITTVRVHHYVESADKTIDEFVKDDFNGNINGTPWAMFITVNEIKKMTLLGLDVRRQTYQQHLGGLDGTGIAYYIKDGADFWIVDYLMNPNEYMNILPIAEQSIATFNLVK